MGQSDRSLTSLGRRVAELQDRAPEAQLDRERGRARFLREGPAGRARPRSWARAAALLAAAALMMAAWIVMRPRAPLRFDVGAMEAGVVGAWIAAPPRRRCRSSSRMDRGSCSRRAAARASPR
ncbi:Hypothetical protein A7982_08843 [Minicystis rosea]|nr:Hypothetical protein A7982_08843 [Minicystis rosea]